MSGAVFESEKIYFVNGPVLAYFDLQSGVFIALHRFEQEIHGLAVQGRVFAVSFEGSDGVAFYSPSVGNFGRLVRAEDGFGGILNQTG